MLINIRQQNSIEYKPFMECDDKEECVRIMKYLLEKDLYMFRIDNDEEITFINRKEDLEYFENRKVKCMKNITNI